MLVVTGEIPVPYSLVTAILIIIIIIIIIIKQNKTKQNKTVGRRKRLATALLFLLKIVQTNQMLCRILYFL